MAKKKLKKELEAEIIKLKRHIYILVKEDNPVEVMFLKIMYKSDYEIMESFWQGISNTKPNINLFDGFAENLSNALKK
jgi:accessory colonization factor AcfC